MFQIENINGPRCLLYLEHDFPPADHADGAAPACIARPSISSRVLFVRCIALAVEAAVSAVVVLSSLLLLLLSFNRLVGGAPIIDLLWG